ncbi:hypothetical protein HU200_067106 [Digitaria exilis]|uniref:KIB1-4 beta-propeller domain-containing protein n=1 Tax=Digitaria exilis TaxID=1010633 RepID=A0A834ZVK4_9POAL|nr:hypothetical protein HU200_067106 [Digitaria exilis]
MEGSTSTPGCAGVRPPLGTLPVLVYDHGVNPNNRRQTAFAIGDQSLRHTIVVPELANNYYHVTPQGWVLLVAPGGPSPRATRLWDPRSDESVSLPAMEHELLPEVWECYLSDAPTAASSCVVLMLDIKKPSFLYCRVGDSRWSTHDYDIGDARRPPPEPPTKMVVQQTAAVDGKFYFQVCGKKLGFIDFSSATPEFTFMDYPLVEFPEGSNCANNQLVASHGELYNVYIYLKEFTPEILTVCIYRIDDPSGQPTLSKVDDLGDRVFLLSDANTQLLCSASKYGVKGNRVYFNHNVMGDMDGGLLCIYDLDDQSLKTVKPCPEMTELLCSPFWMMPTDQDSTREAIKYG